ncbi:MULTISPECIES: hypothetical protein [unclassified Rhizobium]|uniref:hypothetical protein n=1 Tax=unclassified Rhizobium TaxID=2613769 RepID=UPI0011478E5B|nr:MULTISPECIES: hypothetical protein [unclassified Rhizobium]MDM9621953.1 hypothetical protein [Rhizobium sp. S96]
MPATATIGSTNVAAGLPVGLDTWDPSGNWVVPFYTTTEADPKVRLLYNSQAWAAVHAGAWRRSGNDASVEAAILATSSDIFPGHGNVFSSTSASDWVTPTSYRRAPPAMMAGATFHVPASGFRPAAGADGHMAVRQPSGDVLETYGTIVLSDRTIVALSYATTDASGSGDGDGGQSGQTASMLPSYAGAVLDSEIGSGVNHAMAITVPPTLLAPQFVYPAYAFDRDALTNPLPYSGVLPMGTRLALPADIRVSDLHLITAAGRNIATAAQQYGFLIVDRGGRGITIRVRPAAKPSVPALHAFDAQLNHDLEEIFARLRVVVF